MPRLNVAAVKPATSQMASPAHGDDEIVLLQGILREHVGQLPGSPECLQCLGIGHGDTMGGDAGRVELPGYPGRDDRILLGLDDHPALGVGTAGSSVSTRSASHGPMCA
jgi:hypothetical protein